MTNSFEFLPAGQRRLRTPIISLAIFLITAAVFFIGVFSLRAYSTSLETAHLEASARVDNETMGFINRAVQLMPDASIISNLAEKTRLHNLEMGEKASAWTKLFNALDSVLPEDSIVLAIVNPKTGKMSFTAADRQFKISIALTGIEAANAIYMKLATIPSIESLSFAPRGEGQHQGRRSVNVDLEFTFNEAYATAP